MKNVKGIEYLLPLSVISKASKFGLDLNKLKAMVMASARVTHPAGNRRYHNYVFQVEGGLVENIVKIDDEEGVFYKCEDCQDQKKIAVFDECPLCNGVGCRRCDNGLIQNFITCPKCTLKK